MATQSVKDILDTEIPKPSFVLSPSVPAPLPSGVTLTRNGGDDVARTLDPYSGKFEQVAEDTPRVYGSQQSLLVEAASRTNRVLQSANIDGNTSEWSFNGGGALKSEVTSVLDSENAHDIEGTNSNASAQVLQENIGTYSNGEENFSVILEKSTSDNIEIRLQEESSFTSVGKLRYDFSTDSLSLDAGLEVNRRILSSSGPNGGKLVRFILRYDPTSGTDFSGNGRRLILLIDKNANNNSTICHHAQIEEAPNASSPIVTSGSAKTRAADDVTIFDYSNDPDQDQPEWWNPNGMSFFLDLKLKIYNSGFAEIISGDTDRIEIDGDSPFDLFFVDSSAGPKIIGRQFNSVPTFEYVKMGLSVTESEVRLAINGSTSTGNYDGELLSTSSLQINDDIVGLYNSIKAIPRALPESTLNTLTS